MKITPKQYAKVLHDSLNDVKPSDTDTILDNFAQVLQENNHIHLFDQIAEEFHTLELAAKGVKLAQITTAHPLSRENEQAVIEQLNKIVGSKVELKKQIDERLVGGVVIRVDDKLIDASVKNELNQLKNELSA